MIDLGSRLAIPGFIESHGHFTGLGDSLLQLRLADTTSWDEIVARVGAAAKSARPGEWIRGRGWHQEKLTSVPSPNVEGFPLHASLDAVSPDNPVVLEHASGHGTYANPKALELSSITRTTRNPPAGEILCDHNGDPVGFLRETAADLLKTPPVDDPKLVEQQAMLASEEAIAKGITPFEDAGSPFSTIDALRKMSEEGRLPIRLWMMVLDSNERLTANLGRARVIGAANGHFTVRAIKKQIDGALGSRGAWLLEPYADLPSSTGLNTTSVKDVEEAARLAIANGYLMAVHAIGDRANRETAQDLPALGPGFPARTVERVWEMLAHYHGQIWNASEIARAFAISHTTSRRYLDLLVDTFMIRLLPPWSQSIGKRLVKSPKIYFRDSGLLHHLLDIRTSDELARHVKVGASFEGFALHELVRRLGADRRECFFWATHQGAELDLLVVRGSKRLGFEVKHTVAPEVTKSMRVAIADLDLARLDVIHVGKDTYPLTNRIRAVAFERLQEDIPRLR